MAFRWALGLDDGDCAHGPGAGCNCAAAGGAAAQSLDELEFARSACRAAAAGDTAKLARLLDRAPDAVHSDGGKGARALKGGVGRVSGAFFDDTPHSPPPAPIYAGDG